LRGGARALDAVPLMVSTESALSVTTDTERKGDNDNSPPDEKSKILVLPWCTKPPAPTKTRSLQLLSLGRRILRVSHPSHCGGVISSSETAIWERIIWPENNGEVTHTRSIYMGWRFGACVCT